MGAELALLKSCPRIAACFLPKSHSLVTAPILTRDALDAYYRNNSVNVFPQRGLLGSVFSIHQRGSVQNSSDPRLYINLDAPSSGLICGVQV